MRCYCVFGKQACPCSFKLCPQGSCKARGQCRRGDPSVQRCQEIAALPVLVPATLRLQPAISWCSIVIRPAGMRMRF